MQELALGEVMQLLRGVTSDDSVEREPGRLVEPE